MMASKVIKLIKVDTKTNCGLINIQSLLKHSTTALLVIGSLKRSPQNYSSFSRFHAPLPFKCHTLQKIHIRERQLALRTKIICYVALKYNKKFLACSFAYKDQKHIIKSFLIMRPTKLDSHSLPVALWRSSVGTISFQDHSFSLCFPLQLMKFEFRHNDQFCVTNENLTQTQQISTQTQSI